VHAARADGIAEPLAEASALADVDALAEAATFDADEVFGDVVVVRWVHA
jgi:uncharacterized protein YciI